MNGVPVQTQKAAGKQLAQRLGFAGWIVVSVAFWGWIATIAWLGSAMAEPPRPDADFTVLYVVVAFVASLFVGWGVATWLLIRSFKLGREALWLAVIAVLGFALFLQL